MKKIIDKTDNYEVYFTHWIDGFSFTLESPKLSDFIILIGYDERDSEDGDKRKKL